MARIEIKRLLKFTCYSVVFLLIFLYLNNGKFITSNDNASNKSHFIIFSTIYYSTSKLYSENSMIILLNTYKEILQQQPNLNFRCYSKNQTKTMSSQLQIRMATNDPSTNCKWEVFLGNCSTVLNPEFFGITSAETSEIIDLNFKTPVLESFPVVMCYAPMLYESRWQQLIFATEIYHHFGVDLQVQYVNSAMTQIMKILKNYEAKRWIKIEEFAYFDFDSKIISDIGYNPMKEIISRNQHLALTDCVMKYREAADYIIIADIDEILFPKQQNYFTEFSKWTKQFPDAAAFTYHRSYAKIDAAKEFSNFSLLHSIESLQTAESLFMGKSVLKTSKVETPWIHWPGLANGVTVTIDPDQGRIYHVQIAAEKVREVKNRFTLGKPESLKNLKPFNPIPKNEILSLNAKFVSFFSNFTNFKSNFVYANAIFECFKENENWNLEICYTPFQCEIPSNISNYECEMVQRNFSTKIFNKKFVFYVQESNYFWEQNNEKCEIFKQ